MNDWNKIFCFEESPSELLFLILRKSSKNPINEKPIAESSYEIKKDGKPIKKTVWFYEMSVIESFSKEPDDEIDEIALVPFQEAYELLAYEEDKKILRYVFNRK